MSREDRGRETREGIKSHRNLEVYQMAFDAAMEILNYPKNFRLKRDIR